MPSISPARRLSSTDAPLTPAFGPQEHHKSAGAVLSVSQQYSPSLVDDAPPTSTGVNNSASLQRSVYSHNRTRSDDVCDYASVVLRTKSCSTISKPISTAKSKNPMDRSFSIPASPSSEPQLNDDIDTIRAFLESEYVAPTDEFWHLQRDSFIHRSYNKKLLARKNAIDANVLPVKRPASLAVAARKQPTTAGPTTTATTTTDDGSSNNEHSTSTTKLPSAVVKRESFIRQSLNSLRRSFSIRSSAAKKKSAQMEQQSGVKERRIGRKTPTLETEHPNDVHHRLIGTNQKARENLTVNDDGERWVRVEFLNVPLENVRNQHGHSRNSSTSSCTSNR